MSDCLTQILLEVLVPAHWAFVGLDGSPPSE
jgi:hypothetical protein